MRKRVEKRGASRVFYTVSGVLHAGNKQHKFIISLLERT